MNSQTTFASNQIRQYLPLVDSVVMFWWFAYGYFFSQKPAHL
ncbi:hypothetical protein MAMP_02072 [Methylophaga aminisulfidivorans MP]|uniref:Uncharacterized protein n=1 Tax=Methylophaga aminisulfidivorans MP TaxID=1026882 RepID=F5SXE6_9GAMM|nr:hypothetical protein MAMP_02072 [Methylophaga aminisulfidivorans MP]